jgi:hypothetical protein
MTRSSQSAEKLGPEELCNKGTTLVRPQQPDFEDIGFSRCLAEISKNAHPWAFFRSLFSPWSLRRLLT